VLPAGDDFCAVFLALPFVREMKHASRNGRNKTLMVIRERTEIAGKTRTARRQKFEPTINVINANEFRKGQRNKPRRIHCPWCHLMRSLFDEVFNASSEDLAITISAY
jgi:hypothetical protein